MSKLYKTNKYFYLLEVGVLYIKRPEQDKWAVSAFQGAQALSLLLGMLHIGNNYKQK